MTNGRNGGAVIVKIDEKLGLKKEKYRTNVILRSDGTTLYLTKDLALARQKFEQYHVDRSIYVVDSRQSMHLQQAFAILKLWGFPQAREVLSLGLWLRDATGWRHVGPTRQGGTVQECDGRGRSTRVGPRVRPHTRDVR